MAGIDKVHGAGRENDYRARLSLIVPNAVPEIIFGEDAPTVEARWTIDGEQVARVKFQFRDDYTIIWTSLQVAPEFQRHGVYTGLLQRLHDLFQEHGVTTYLAYPRDEFSSRLLQLLGFQPTQNPDEIAVENVGPDDRMSEYIAWKAGGDEPDWHSVLKAAIG